MNRVLILGGNGMLGHKVFQVLSKEYEVHATFTNNDSYISALPVYKAVPNDRIHINANALEPNTIGKTISEVTPLVVVNCIGLIKQLKDIQNKAIATRINTEFPHYLSDVCDRNSVKLIHISTDCVFSGRKGMYTEKDSCDALDLYGKSKALGEITNGKHLTIRTSIIGRELVRSTGLLEWFLSCAGKQVKGYKNVFFSGLTTEELSYNILNVISYFPNLSGLYHISSRRISKYSLLSMIEEAWNLRISILPYESMYCDRSLDSSKYFAETGFNQPLWKDMITDLINEKTPYSEWREHNAAIRK